MAIKTTTYRVGYAERCHSCGSVRSGRGIGEYEKHDNGLETLINCSDCHRSIACECGKVYPLSESEKLSPARINGIAKACTACMPSRHPREMTKAADRIRLTLARHIAKMRRAHMKRTIYRDVAVRYLRLFGGSTFSVQTDVDACEIYLENAKGMIIGKVSTLDLYPKGFDDVVVDEIPF